MPRRLRLDAELVRRGLARSREHASELIAAGRVTVSGARATKPATGVTTDIALPGPSGNLEGFLWLRRGPATVTAAERDDVVRVGVRADPASSVPGEKVDP